MKTKHFSKFLILLSLAFLNLGISAQENGNFGTYLVGKYDLRKANTIISIINPTGHELYVFIALLDDNENMQQCLYEYLSPNDLVELNMKQMLKKSDSIQFGVVKVISLKDKKLDPRNVVPGVVGFQQHFYGRGCFRSGITESNMAAVPNAILEEEIKILLKKCDRR